jgi:hypothetical protein
MRKLIVISSKPNPVSVPKTLTMDRYRLKYRGTAYRYSITLSFFFRYLIPVLSTALIFSGTEYRYFVPLWFFPVLDTGIEDFPVSWYWIPVLGDWRYMYKFLVLGLIYVFSPIRNNKNNLQFNPTGELSWHKIDFECGFSSSLIFFFYLIDLNVSSDQKCCRSTWTNTSEKQNITYAHEIFFSILFHVLHCTHHL